MSLDSIPHPLSLWKNRRYVMLIGSQIVSNLGDWMYILALLILVGVRWHGSPMTISLTMLCIMAPVMLLGPFSGVIADRLNKSAVMLTSNLVMAAATACIPLVPRHFEVFVLLVIMGAVESLFAPAEQAKLKEVVRLEQLEQAVPINSAISQLAKIAGPSISGILVGAFGPDVGFYLDSASFVLSSVFLLFTGLRSVVSDAGVESMEDTQVSAHDEGFTRNADPDLKSSMWSEARQGFLFLREKKSLLIGTLLLTLILLVLQLTDSQFVTILRLLPHLSPNLFGYVMAASGVGALLASVLVGRRPTFARLLTLGIGAVAVGVGFGGIAVIVSLHLSQWIVLILSVCAGGGAGLVFVPFQVMLQKQTPAQYTGRVFGLVSSLTTGAALVGPVIGGLLLTAFGAVPGFLLSGLSLATIGLLSMGLNRWMDPRDEHVTQGDGIVQEAATP